MRGLIAIFIFQLSDHDDQPVDGPVRAQARGDALDKRRSLMAWAAFLEGTESKVLPLARRLTF
jgi:hypothetical protein